MPSATSLVARSYPDQIIGVDNALPWHLGTDLKHFKERTQHHAVIMGRKTFESIGRPLPNRLSIVLSRQNVADTGSVRWAPNPETALLLADQYSVINLKNEFYVIGGEEIYSIFDKYINVVYLTDVNTGRINGDAKFTKEFRSPEWIYRYEREFPSSEINDYSFRISCIIRRRPFHRFLAKNNLFGDDVGANAAWDRYVSLTARSENDDILYESQLHFLDDL